METYDLTRFLQAQERDCPLELCLDDCRHKRYDKVKNAEKQAE